MQKLSMVDKGFLIGESREMPMHVAGVSLFTLPDGADEQQFLQDIADNLKDAEALLPPFGDRLKTGRLGMAGNVYWEPDPALDLDYHIRHSALPKPGRYRELFTLVSRLHGQLTSRNSGDDATEVGGAVHWPPAWFYCLFSFLDVPSRSID